MSTLPGTNCEWQWKKPSRAERKKKKKKEKKKENIKSKKAMKKSKRRVLDELIWIQRQERILGSLEMRKKRWKRKMKVPKEVWAMLEDGVPLMFEGGKRPKPRLIKEIRMEKNAKEAMERYVKEQMELGFVREDKRPATVISPIFVIPKKEKNKWRVIVDLRHVNKSQKTPKFKHENLDNLGLIVRPGDFMVKGDVKHGFHHLRMKEEHTRYLGFRHGNRWFRYIAMPMGSQSSPYVFNRMLKPAIGFLRESEGIRITWYVDDFLVAAETKEKAEKDMMTTLKLLREIGWHINWEKTEVEAKQQQEFLGLVVDTTGDEPKLRVPYQKKRSIKRQIRKLLKDSMEGSVTVREIAKVAGMCQAVSRAVATTPIYIRNLMRTIPKMNKEEWNTRRVHLPKEAKMDLIRWIEILENWGGQALVRRPTNTILETDASDSGWGAFLRTTRKETKGVWNSKWKMKHINVKELQAVLLTVRRFKEELRGKSILLKIDNQVAMAYVNRMTGRIPELARIAREIIQELEQIGANIQAIYIPSEENIIADRLSRETDVHDWEVTRNTFRRLQKRAGKYTIDRFACQKTKKTTRYNSRLGEKDSEAADGLSVSWKHENNWIVPPIPLITKVVLKLKREKAEATVIVPDWKGQAWHRALREMAIHEERLEEKEIRKNNTTWVNKKWSFRAFLIYGR
jgi:hypothetical protein